MRRKMAVIPAGNEGLAEMAGVSAGDDGTEDDGDSGRGWRVRVLFAAGAVIFLL